MTDDTPGVQWQRLCGEWRKAHEAALRFPLFEGRWMQIDRLNEARRLCAIKQEVRGRMDRFIATHR